MNRIWRGLGICFLAFGLHNRKGDRAFNMGMNKFLVFIEFHDGRLFKYETTYLRLNEVWGKHDRLMDEAIEAGQEEFKAWDSDAEVKSFKVYPMHDVVVLD